jgi:1-deoxy-D-xylulose-5-phosphate synthase
MTLLSPSSESQMTEFIRESLSHQTVIARSEATKQSSDLNDSPDTGLLRFARNDVLGPVAIRYPRGGPEPLDRSSLITDRPEAVILSTGIMTYVAASASRLLSDAGFDVSVYEMTRIHPLDTPLLDEISALGVPVFTLEDGAVYGGFGEAVCAYYSSKDDAPKVTVLGWPNEFIPHGTVEELRREYGLDAQSIASRIREAV